MSCNCGSCISCESIYELPSGLNGADGNDGADGAEGKGYAGSVDDQSIDIDTLPTTVSVTIEPGLAYSAGARVRFSATTNPELNFFEGVVTSYSDVTGVIVVDNIDVISGASAFTNWKVNLAGEPYKINALIASINKQTTANYSDPVSTLAIPVGEVDFGTLVVDNTNNHAKVFFTAKVKIKLTATGGNIGTFKVKDESLSSTLAETLIQFSFSAVADSVQEITLSGFYENYTAGDRIRIRLAGSPNFEASYPIISAMTLIDPIP